MQEMLIQVRLDTHQKSIPSFHIVECCPTLLSSLSRVTARVEYLDMSVNSWVADIYMVLLILVGAKSLPEQTRSGLWIPTTHNSQRAENDLFLLIMQNTNSFFKFKLICQNLREFKRFFISLPYPFPPTSGVKLYCRFL